MSAKAGITHCGWGFGVAAGDYDNDGWEDLYITYLDGAVLYHNNGDGTFTDVTPKPVSEMPGAGAPARPSAITTMTAISISTSPTMLTSI